MNGRYHRLMKNSVIFMIANFGSKFFTFILVPFYTHVLSTAEYGTVDTLVATVSLFSPIATLGIGDVITMFLSKKEYDRKKLFTNTSALVIIGNIIVSLIYPFFFMSDIFRNYIFYFICLVFISSIYGVLQMYARGTDKVTTCALSGVIYTIALSVSNIIILLWLKWGISGYLLSTILAYLIPSIYLFFSIEEKSFKFSLLDKSLMRNITKLSLPLIPTTILWSFMNLADKYAILWIIGIVGNGIYSVALKIPSIISVIYSIFQPAWQLTTFELESKTERSITYTKVFELLTCVMFSSAALLVILNRIYIIYFCDSSYISAWQISPILIYGSVLNCLSGLLGSNYLIMRNTKDALKVTAFGAIINVIFNFILVPMWGLFGAAIATCMGYLYMVIKKYFDTSDFTPLKINKKRFFVANIILILMCISVIINNVTIFYVFNIFLIVCMTLIYLDQYHKVFEFIFNTIQRRK